MSTTILNSSIIDKEIADTNKINQGYGDANAYYNNILTNMKYKEITPNNNPELIDIGCICNTEYSSDTMNADRYWDKNTSSISTINARKLINDLEWAEQSNLHNGTIKSSPGMVLLTKNADAYNKDDTTYFNDVANNATGPTANFNSLKNITTSGNGAAIDLFGYFHPDATGTWQFALPPSNPGTNIFTYLWVGDSALYDYTASNANINSTTSPQSNNTVSATFTMNKDDYIPFRIQIISKNSKPNSQTPIFTIIPPQNSAAKGTLITNPSSGDWNYFVTFTKDGAVYYKNLLYFGLVKSDTDPSNFDCYFVNTNSTNTATIRKNKCNPKLQYIKVEIPTPTMTGTGTINVMDSEPVNLNFPTGVRITVTSAYYGMPDPTYYYTTYSTQMIPQSVTVPASTVTVVPPTSDTYLPTKPDTITTGSYTTTVTQPTVVPNPPTAVNQQINVTAQLQQMINNSGGNKLIIAGGNGNFLNLFGNPIADPNNDPNGSPTVLKTLHIEYSFTVDESIISDKYIFLNPANGIITAGATFYNNSVATAMTMDSTPSCSGDTCKQYKMQLATEMINNVKTIILGVYDGNNNRVGYINLKNTVVSRNSNFDMEKCQVNSIWLDDPYIKTTLNAGISTSSVNGKKIKSPDGRFKLEFENRKLILTYCYIPFTRSDSGLCYTTTFNKSNMDNSQILYLYRINTRGLFGRKFLQETNSSTGDTIMHYIPNTHDNVLKQSQDPNSFSKLFNQPIYPLFKDGSPSFTDNYNSNTTDANTYEKCANQCLVEPNNKCEHFFFVSNSDGTTRCYTDKIADANPAYSLIKTHSNINNSDLYKKPYKIKTTCGIMQDEVNLIYNSSIPSSTIDYRIPENAPNMTYYCGLDRYKQDNQQVSSIYNKDNTRQKDGNNGTVSCDDYCASSNWGGFSGQCADTINNDKSNSNTYKCSDIPSSMLNGSLTNVSCKCIQKEAMTNMVREGMTTSASDQFNRYAPYEIINRINRYPILDKLSQQYSQTQDKIDARYNETIDKLGQYENLYQAVSSPQYNYNGTDSLIPDKFQNNKNPKPNISYVDGAKKDVGIMLMQQNTMYTLASITAATCLILSVMFTGGGSE